MRDEHHHQQNQACTCQYRWRQDRKLCDEHRHQQNQLCTCPQEQEYREGHRHLCQGGGGSGGGAGGVGGAGGSDDSPHGVSLQARADYAPNWVAEHLGASSRRPRHPFPALMAGEPLAVYLCTRPYQHKRGSFKPS